MEKVGLYVEKSVSVTFLNIIIVMNDMRWSLNAA